MIPGGPHITKPKELLSLRHNNSLSQCPELSPVPGSEKSGGCECDVGLDTEGLSSWAKTWVELLNLSFFPGVLSSFGDFYHELLRG